MGMEWSPRSASLLYDSELNSVAGVAGTSLQAAGGTFGSNGTQPPARNSMRVPMLKRRKYAHFDDQFDDEQLTSFSVTPEEVMSHGFLPLLGYEKIIRRMDFEDDFPTLELKSRDIRYASHFDAAIYSFYARPLSLLYDDALEAAGLSASVLAYRSNIGNNVTFAKSLFDEVNARGDCKVICLDISKFFDRIDHKILENRLRDIFGLPKLSGDWIKIFNRITAYECVMKSSLEKAIGKRYGPRICSIETFKKHVRPLISKHTEPFGIPQGTPLSGLLANIFLLEFDKQAIDYVRSVGGSYRRYSDDIALVLPSSMDENTATSHITALLHSQRLDVNPKKTCQTTFMVRDSKQQHVGDLLQYLGFTFDGETILIRSSSIKNFYAKMKRGVRAYVRGARRNGAGRNEIRKRVPIGRFTHWGDNKNFVQYAYRAAQTMNSPAIKRQLRRHVAIFDAAWTKAVSKYYDAPAV
jgi:RNA-directed DNA polymerase